MKLRGRIKGIARDMLSGECRVTFGVASVPDMDALLKEEDLDIEVKKHRESRSLNANAYYWSLVGRMADILKAPKSEIHNRLLRDYGTLEEAGGQLVTLLLPDEDEVAKEVDRKETYHLKPTSHLKEGKDGRMFRAYFLIKGSSEYDTKEMSTLIDGAISEAKELGIETLTPEEHERMMAAYEEHHAARR